MDQLMKFTFQLMCCSVCYRGGCNKNVFVLLCRGQYVCYYTFRYTLQQSFLWVEWSYNKKKIYCSLYLAVDCIAVSCHFLPLTIKSKHMRCLGCSVASCKFRSWLNLSIFDQKILFWFSTFQIYGDVKLSFLWKLMLMFHLLPSARVIS